MHYYVLIRHAEAIKNVKKLHGGKGTSLTPKGVNDALKFGEFIQDELNVRFDKVYFSPRLHCKETASLISSVLSVPVRELSKLVPIRLGIVDGLTQEEVRIRYPDIALSIDKWRNGNIEISDLNVPGMEDKDSFYRRGESIISSIVDKNENSMLVLSRSLLVLITSILLKRTTKRGGNYREIIWNNLEYIIFSKNDKGLLFHIDQSKIRI